MRMTAEGIADRLGGEVRGDQVLAPGPGHSEKDRSLSVKIDASAPGGFVVHSFAGDDAIECRDYVREKLGLPKWNAGVNGSPFLAEYVYRTENGDPYLLVRRTREKSFPQYHWDGKSWAKGKPRGPKIPYRLPELLRADEIFVVEGEKDADSLALIGLTGTTNSEGAANNSRGNSKKWTPELNEWFRGKTVYVLPDNDKDGRRHADYVASSLLGIASDVRVVELPGLPPKGDVSDWLEDGGDAESLLALCRAVPPYDCSCDRGPVDGQTDRPPNEGISTDDFYAYMPMHNYIFVPSRQTWPAGSVNARIPPVPLLDASGRPIEKDGKHQSIPASLWLDKNKSVEQMTWAPGLPTLVRDRLISEGGWIDHPGVACFNLYREPTIKPGDPTKARPWLKHVVKVYGKTDGKHIILWLAHRVQRPHEKINHALFLGGSQGIGKDTLLEPLKRAIGSWNFIEVSPVQMLGRFNGFLKSVILRVSEARDLGDMDRFKFYDHLKAYTAAPPDVLRIDEKNLREYYVPNVCGVIITSNHKSDGIYLPADDRRHYVAWSDRDKSEFDEAYWNNIWQWYDTGGERHVGAYLAALDISSFNPKVPPPKTQAFWSIVDANRAPEDAELADALDALGNPDAVLLSQIAVAAEGAGDPNSFASWVKDRRNRRVIPHRLEKCGYVPVRNDDAESGLWVVSGRRQVIYGKASLAPRDRLKAAKELRDKRSPY